MGTSGLQPSLSLFYPTAAATAPKRLCLSHLFPFQLLGAENSARLDPDGWMAWPAYTYTYILLCFGKQVS